MKKISEMNDPQLCNLIDNRWRSSDKVWDTIQKTTSDNKAIYKNEPNWIKNVSRKKSKVRFFLIHPDVDMLMMAVLRDCHFFCARIMCATAHGTPAKPFSLFKPQKEEAS